MRVQRVGSGLYCVHELFSYTTLTIGPIGPAIEIFGIAWKDGLLKLGINRIGVKAPHNEGGFFNLK